MDFKVFIISLLIVLNISCSKTSDNKPTQKAPAKTDPSSPFFGIYEGTNVIVMDTAFDREAFKKEIRQKTEQIDLPEEEKQEKVLALINGTKELRKTTHQQLQTLFSDSSFKPDEIASRSIQIIDSIDLEVRKIINDSFIPKYFDQKTVEKFIYLTVLEEESQAQKSAKNLMDEYIANQLRDSVNSDGGYSTIG